MGPLEFWPPDGFPMLYNSSPSKPSLLMLRFLNPVPDQLINVRCQLSAAKISLGFHTELFVNQFHLYLEKEGHSALMAALSDKEPQESDSVKQTISEDKNIASVSISSVLAYANATTTTVQGYSNSSTTVPDYHTDATVMP